MRQKVLRVCSVVVFLVGIPIVFSALLPVGELRNVPDDMIWRASLFALLNGMVRFIVGFGFFKLAKFLADKSHPRLDKPTS